MSKISATIFLISFLLGITGCSIGSIYGPGYYSETKLGSDVIRVTFRGYDHPMTGDLCLLRCAEVALESGNEYFQVLDSESGSSINQVSPSYPFHPHYHTDVPFIRDVTYVTKTIRLLKTEEETDFSYDAKEVKDSSRLKYEIE